LARVTLCRLVRRFPLNHILENRLEFPQMLLGGRADDDGLAPARTLDLAHAEAQSLQPSPDLRCAQPHVQAEGLVNLFEQPREMTVMWDQLGIQDKHRVRDVWHQQDVGESDGASSAEVGHHGLILVQTKPDGGSVIQRPKRRNSPVCIQPPHVNNTPSGLSLCPPARVETAEPQLIALLPPLPIASLQDCLKVLYESLHVCAVIPASSDLYRLLIGNGLN
jgi:hypothetical protein